MGKADAVTGNWTLSSFMPTWHAFKSWLVKFRDRIQCCLPGSCWSVFTADEESWWPYQGVFLHKYWNNRWPESGCVYIVIQIICQYQNIIWDFGCRRFVFFCFSDVNIVCIYFITNFLILNVFLCSLSYYRADIFVTIFWCFIVQVSSNLEIII